MQAPIETNQQDNNCTNLALFSTAFAGRAGLTAGVEATATVLAALMLPHHGYLTGGLGMIAAAGAVVGSFTILLNISLEIGIPLIFKEDFREKNSIIYKILQLGTAIAAIFITSMVMGQPFLPLLACITVGGLAMLGAAFFGILLFAFTADSMCKNTPNDLNLARSDLDLDRSDEETSGLYEIAAIPHPSVKNF